MLRQTTVPTVIDSFYLLTLGSYRAFYILNWILRSFYDPDKPDAIAVIFGVVQTAFYVDFAWVYWTRQRVKLRNGGVVDSEDLSRGWLVSKVLGRATPDVDEENVVGANEESTARHVGSRSGWGRRGISVSASADEAVSDDRTPRSRARPVETDPSTRPEEAVGILGGDEEDFSDDDAVPPNNDAVVSGSLKGVGNGEEWQNHESK